MTIKVAQHPDREEDSPRHEQMSGSMLLMAGKYKGQNVTMRAAYCEDKGYLDWIRTHINEKSHQREVGSSDEDLEGLHRDEGSEESREIGGESKQVSIHMPNRSRCPECHACQAE